MPSPVRHWPPTASNASCVARRVATLADATSEDVQTHYGPLKALAEQEAAKYWPQGGRLTRCASSLQGAIDELVGSEIADCALRAGV
jgi:hypothetical protein